MIKFDYDSKATENKVLKELDFKTMFENTDKEKCPITKCSIKKKLCKEAYTGTNVKLTGDEASGFVVSAA